MSSQSRPRLFSPQREQCTDSAPLCGTSHATLFLQDWRDNVSRLHPPHVWYTASHAPAPSASAPVERALGAESPLNVLYPSISSSISTLSTLARTGDLIGCTVTLTLPDSTTRTFSTPNVHASRRGARRTVFALAYESGVLDEAARMRAELGWDAEVAEENAGKESVRKMRGGERPWEALKAEQERWMAEPIKWRFETDELSAYFVCSWTARPRANAPCGAQTRSIPASLPCPFRRLRRRSSSRPHRPSARIARRRMLPLVLLSTPTCQPNTSKPSSNASIATQAATSSSATSPSLMLPLRTLTSMNRQTRTEVSGMDRSTRLRC